MINDRSASLSRRQFVTGVIAGSTLYGLGPPCSVAAGVARNQPQISMLRGNQFNLDIGYHAVNFTGRERLATAVNGSVPAPI